MSISEPKRDRRKPIAIPLEPAPEETIPHIPCKPMLSAREAAAALGVERSSITRFIQEGKLRCEQLQTGRRDRFFRYEDIVRLSESESSLKRYRREALRVSLSGRLPISEAVHKESLITPRDAANLLGTSIHVIRRYIYENRIFAFQDYPARSGSRCYLLPHAVMRLKKEREERRKRAANNKRPPTEKNIAPIWEDADLGGNPLEGWSPCVEVDHGNFLSTRQASIILGTTTSTVSNLRSRGRLQGYQFEYRHRIDHQFNTPIPQKGYSHWFFKREDIDKLLNDPAYQKRRRHWKYGLSEEARAIRQQKADRQTELEAESCLRAMGYVQDSFGNWHKF